MWLTQISLFTMQGKKYVYNNKVYICLAAWIILFYLSLQLKNTYLLLISEGTYHALIYKIIATLFVISKQFLQLRNKTIIW